MYDYYEWKKSFLQFNIDNYGLSQIEITSIDNCNRRCNFCPYSHAYKGDSKKIFTIDNANILKDRLIDFDYQGVISLCGRGEPLLNKHITDIIGILCEYKVFLITNGDVIRNNSDIIHRLFDNGLNTLIISEYDDVKNFYLYDKLNYNIIVRDLTKASLDKNNFNNRGGAMEPIEDSLKTQCYLPFYKMMVDYDLNVHFCEQDWKYKHSIGNLSFQSISDIWLSEQMMSYRKKLSKGHRNEILSCSKCNVKGNLLGENSFQYFMDTL